jgi:hypothetical protein
MFRAVESLQTEWEKEAMDKFKTSVDRLDPSKPFKPTVRVITGKEAEAIADKPYFTGDPEWDKIEREETDPNREPFDRSRFI